MGHSTGSPSVGVRSQRKVQGAFLFPRDLTHHTAWHRWPCSLSTGPAPRMVPLGQNHPKGSTGDAGPQLSPPPPRRATQGSIYCTRVGAWLWERSPYPSVPPHWHSSLPSIRTAPQGRGGRAAEGRAMLCTVPRRTICERGRTRPLTGTLTFPRGFLEYF